MGASLIYNRQKARNFFARAFGTRNSFSDGWNTNWQNLHLRFLHKFSRSVIIPVYEAGGSAVSEPYMSSIAAANKQLGLGLGFTDEAKRSLHTYGFFHLFEVHIFHWIFLPSGADSGGQATNKIAALSIAKAGGALASAANAARDVSKHIDPYTKMGDGLAKAVNFKSALQQGIKDGGNAGLAEVRSYVEKRAASLRTDMLCVYGSHDAVRNWSVPSVRADSGQKGIGGMIVDNTPTQPRPAMYHVSPGEITIMSLDLNDFEGFQSRRDLELVTGWSDAAVVSITPVWLKNWSSEKSGQAFISDWSTIDAGGLGNVATTLDSVEKCRRLSMGCFDWCPNPLAGNPGYVKQHYLRRQQDEQSANGVPLHLNLLNDPREISWQSWSSWTRTGA